MENEKLIAWQKKTLIRRVQEEQIDITFNYNQIRWKKKLK